MYKAAVKFASVEDAKTFAGICNEVDFKVELVAEPYVIDAKSLMGLVQPGFFPADCPAGLLPDDGSAFAGKKSGRFWWPETRMTRFPGTQLSRVRHAKGR